MVGEESEQIIPFSVNSVFYNLRLNLKSKIAIELSKVTRFISVSVKHISLLLWADLLCSFLSVITQKVVLL